MIRGQMKYSKMLQRNGIYFAALSFIFLSAATAAQAAEEASGPAEHTNEIFKWINFAIVAGVIVWLFAKKLPPIFRGNAEKISSAISKATAAKAEADRQLKEAQTKLANMKQEIDALRATAEKDGVAEGDRIRNQTVSDAKKISAAGKMEVDAAERAARLELKAIAAKLAVDGAELLLAKQLTPAVQATVLAHFANRLEGKAN